MKFGRDGRSEIAERIRDTAEDLMELVSAQVKLLRLELLGDARLLGARLVRVAIFLPLAVLGWGFLASAGAWALGSRIGLGWSLALFGIAHVTVGGVGLARAARSVRQVKMLDRSRDELERSLKAIAPADDGTPAVVTPPGPRPAPLPPASSGGPDGAASSGAPPAGGPARG
jgi:hypothetical protein